MSTPTVPTFDPFSQQAHDDPYPMYSRLRAARRPTFHEDLGMWAVSTHVDVMAVVENWKAFSSVQGEDIDDTASFMPAGNLLEHDPPDHRVLRSILQGSFNPK